MRGELPWTTTTSAAHGPSSAWEESGVAWEESGAPAPLPLKLYSLETLQVCIRRRRAGKSSFTAVRSAQVGVSRAKAEQHNTNDKYRLKHQFEGLNKQICRGNRLKARSSSFPWRHKLFQSCCGFQLFRHFLDVVSLIKTSLVAAG